MIRMVSEMPLPKGRVTIVFTDIENSSLMTSDLGNAAYLEQLRNPHQKVLMEAFERHHGVPIQTQGDSFMAVFQFAKDALACVTAIQNQLVTEPLTASGQTRQWTLRVRIGVHTTEQEVSPNRLAWIPNADLVAGAVEYSGTDTNFAARVGGLGIGGQIIVSNSTYRAAETKSQYGWQDWPNRRLKSFEAAPETVWELLYDGQSRGEPGMRWVPNWYRGELNRYIARPDLQEPVINYFQKGRDNIRKRLVTLYAEGGMGKSRLAVACALEMVGLFRDGVYFVNLTRDEADHKFRTREAVAQDIGLALGLANQELQPENLLASLRSSERLLVLDNYESVDSQEVRRFVRDLIVQTNSLCLLVTGRTPVNLPDVEQIVPMNEGMAPEQARSLFLAYAGLTERGQQWTPDSEDENDLERVLKLTERIPLAAELAAAWVGSRSIKEIADGLQRTPLGHMTRMPGDTDRADPSPHHYSLTRSLDWSYSLLKAEARKAFAPLSLFAASFGKEAVAAVLALDMEEAEDVLDYLHRVSLVRRTESNKTSRHSLHRFTREYAMEKFTALSKTDTITDAIRQRFVAHYTQLVADNNSLNNAKHRAVLTAEWQNTLAAVSVAETTEDWSSVLSLSNLGDFLGLRGMWSEQERLYLSSFAAAKASGNRLGEARTLNNLGSIYRMQGHWDKAEQVHNESLVISREMGDRLGEATTLGSLGSVYQSRGQWDKAEQAYKQSLAIKRGLGDRRGEAGALNNLGIVYQSRGQWDKAEQVYEESLIISRELGDRLCEGRALGNLGIVYNNRGQWGRAEQAYKESLVICRELGDRQGEAGTLGNLSKSYSKRGNFYSSLGQRDRAKQAHEESLTIDRKLGDRQGEGKTLNNLGLVYGSLGQWDRAEQVYEESLVIKRKLGDRQGAGGALNNLGIVYASRGLWDKAEQAFQQNLQICRGLGDRQGEGRALENIALLMQAQGKQEEAIAHAREAVTVLEQTEDAAGLAKVQKLLAKLEG